MMLVTTCGITVADVIVADLPNVPKPGTVIYSTRGIGLHLGGHASDVSVDLCKLGLRGKEVSLVGSVGEDVFGDFIEKELAKFGIVAHLNRVKKVGTSKSIILDVKGQDKRVVNEVGANWHLDSEKVIETLTKEMPTVFYVGATGMLGEFDLKLPRILRQAKAHGCTTFVDAVSPYNRPSNLVMPALRWTDFIHCNDIEAMEITGEKNVLSAAMALAEHGAKLVIVTSGLKGGTALTRNFRLKFPSFRVKVVDPNGAGDAFCAGIIRKVLDWQRKGALDEKKSVLQNPSPDDLIRMMMYGAAAGAACCLKEGTTTSVTKENVRRLLHEQGLSFQQNTRCEKVSASK